MHTSCRRKDAGPYECPLCEVDISYDKLYEMDDINPEFEECDLAIVVGANDVINPAANTAEGTPIYGMPCWMRKANILFNFDKTGYSSEPAVFIRKGHLMLGDAKETVERLAIWQGKRVIEGNSPHFFERDVPRPGGMSAYSFTFRFMLVCLFMSAGSPPSFMEYYSAAVLLRGRPNSSLKALIKLE